MGGSLYGGMMGLRTKPFHVRRPMPSLAGRGGMDSGVDRLLACPPSPNAVAPVGVLEFLGVDADATNWDEAAARAAAFSIYVSTPTFGQQTPWLGPREGAVLGDGAAFYSSLVDTVGNVATSDIWVRVVARVVASKLLGGKKNGAGVGYIVGFDATPALYITITDASGSVTVTSGALVAGTWILGDAVINRDEAGANGGVVYVDQAAGAGVDCSGTAATLDSASFLSLLADYAGNTPAADMVAFLGFYWKADWLRAGATGQADALEQHKRGCAALRGQRPLISWAGSTRPTAGGTTSPAYQEKVVSSRPRLSRQAGRAHRFSQVLDSGGRAFVGMLIEAEATNAQTNSRAISSWAAGGAPTVTGGQSDIEGGAGASLVGDVTGSGGNSIYDSGVPDAAGGAYLPSFWFKRSSTSGVLSRVDANGGAPNGHLTIDLSQTALDNWTLIHPASPYVTLVVPFSSNASLTGGAWFYRESGGDPLAFFLDHVQTEFGAAFATSRIVTAAAGVTRAADSPLRVFGAAHFGYASQGSLFFRFLAPSFTPARSHYLWTAYVAGSAATDYIACYLDSSGHFNVGMAASGGAAGAISRDTNYCDNVIHDCVVSWSKNNLRAWVDGLPTSVDTSCDVPSALDTLDWGVDNAAGNPSACVLPGCEYQLIDHETPDPLLAPCAFAFK